MPPNKQAVDSLSATNLASHHHYQCDLYLHKSFHKTRTSSPRARVSVGPNSIDLANFERGNAWESRLFDWLSRSGLLLTTHHGGRLLGEDIKEIIAFDDREHFYISGISFLPPADAFREKFQEYGRFPVTFGRAKPDLLEIRKLEDGTVSWQVIDLKASQNVTTSHHVQIYFYHLCLQVFLPRPQFSPSSTASIWLSPTAEGELGDKIFKSLVPVDIAILSSSLDDFFFRRVPEIIHRPQHQVKWHYNPVCRGCSHESSCKANTISEGKLGQMANLSLRDVEIIDKLLALARPAATPRELTDIEELDQLVHAPHALETLAEAHPTLVKKAKKILMLGGRQGQRPERSPRITAVTLGAPQPFKKRSFTFPRNEDIAIIISLVLDPTDKSIGYFSLSSFSSIPNLHKNQYVSGPSRDLVHGLSSLLRPIVNLQDQLRAPRTQVYTFSFAERAALQQYLINVALDRGESPADDVADVQLCLGALCEGAALLATTFQPVILSGALLDFLGKQRRWSAADLRRCTRRLGLSSEGSRENLLAAIQKEVNRLKVRGNRALNAQTGQSDGSSFEIGLLPRIVIVRSELEQLIAIPNPGYWDLPQVFRCLAPGVGQGACPSDDGLYTTFRRQDFKKLEEELLLQNECIFDIIGQVRRRLSPSATEATRLVNEARVLTSNFMDLCQEEHLRKLFYMQQFEVLTRLSDLWRARVAGCPDAPIIQYRGLTKTKEGLTAHSFILMSGLLEAPTTRDRAFYNFIMSEDTDEQLDIPVEALFDDLAVHNTIFPLNKYSRSKWGLQPKVVQDKLFVVDLVDQEILAGRLEIIVQVWSLKNVPLRSGANYRISPRLVDFNVQKILSTLVELDLSMGNTRNSLRKPDPPPFLKLITDPQGFAAQHLPAHDAYQFLQAEKTVDHFLRQLDSLDVEPAKPLLLKMSQRRAAQRVLSNGLAIIWGPPGTGKTHTIALALLRLLEVRARCQQTEPFIIFVTAMTHAAIQAVLSKIRKLSECYHSIPHTHNEWLSSVKVEHVEYGIRHPPPMEGYSYIYAGTVFQLHNFAKEYNVDVSCVVIDEAGQLGLGAASLVLRSLRSQGKVIVAGDTEQLAPILAASYPAVKPPLFGSILNCLMDASQGPSSDPEVSFTEADGLALVAPSQISTVIQLVENFRLNPDIGELVSIIYAKRFRPQKAQARKVAKQLASLNKSVPFEGVVSRLARETLVALSNAMLNVPQNLLKPPKVAKNVVAAKRRESLIAASHQPISLALVRLQLRTIRNLRQTSIEDSIRREASFAAALVRHLQKVAPHESIFVATPHRVQRHAVVKALQSDVDELAQAFNSLDIEGDEIENGPSANPENVTVDTVERLQGAEAAFVICLFCYHPSHTGDTSGIPFLLERRRLNVAISRAKTLCIMLSTEEVLRPPVQILSNPESAKGFAFLKAFEEHSWSTNITIESRK